MSSNKFDILIAGGGIAGQIAALALAGAKTRVLCVDPAQTAPDDLRSTAFLNPSVALLEDIGAFDALQPHAACLETMRICDAGDVDNYIRSTVDFIASEIGATQFGWNIPNADLRRVLTSKIETHPNISFRRGISVKTVTPRLHDSVVELSDGSFARSQLVVAADGRGSRLREAAGIDVTTQRYGQKALVFQVRHTEPHQDTSIELHRTGGPFTIVPLPDPNASAIVWMDQGPQIDKLSKLDEQAFSQAATERSCESLGQLEITSERAVWPIISQSAHRMSADRLALIAEAAHVVPPIGAQGLNMSLSDIACLRDLIAKSPQDPGAPDLLKTYERKRKPDVALRLRGIDALNRAALAQNQDIRNIRGELLRMLGKTSGLKEMVMRLGVGN